MKKITAWVIATSLVLFWSLSALPAFADSNLDIPPEQRVRSMVPTPPGIKDPSVKEEEKPPSLRNAWLQGDERQQEKLAGCFHLSETLIQHSRDIKKMLVVSEVKWKDVASQYEDLQRGIHLLMEKHDEFSLGLNNGQQSWWERQLTEIMAIELQLQERSDSIRHELNEEKPASIQMMKAFSDLEGQLRKWNSYYSQIGSDMNIENLDQQAPGKIRGLPGAQNLRR